jgi:hypothetical protein
LPYEQAADLESLKRIVVDREGMSAEFLAVLAGEGRTVVTVLRTDQYAGQESFREVGAFVPLQADRQGKVIREVALARIALPLPDHPGQELEVRVARIRDWRRLVPNEYWLDESWQATPLPAPPMELKLIPIVTTAAEADAIELVQTYTRRWPVQENAIRDWLIPLGIGSGNPIAPATRSFISARSTVGNNVSYSDLLRIWNSRSEKCTNWATTKIK